jgi:hypothetical protein
VPSGSSKELRDWAVLSVCGPLVVGLTVVAYGTSAPGFVVSSMAAFEGRGAIAMANVIGSNITNIGLVLGLSAMIAPVQVEGGLIARELPVSVGATLLLPILLAAGGVNRPEAALLLLGAALFTFVAARVPPRVLSATPGLVEADAETAGAPSGGGRSRLLAIAAAGLIILLVGGQVFVQGAVTMAKALGISDRIIGLTIIAVATSTPELAASVVAALRGHSAIAVGNVISPQASHQQTGGVRPGGRLCRLFIVADSGSLSAVGRLCRADTQEQRGADHAGDGRTRKDTQLADRQQPFITKSQSRYEKRHGETDASQPACAMDLTPGQTGRQRSEVRTNSQPCRQRDAHRFAEQQTQHHA